MRINQMIRSYRITGAGFSSLQSPGATDSLTRAPDLMPAHSLPQIASVASGKEFMETSIDKLFSHHLKNLMGERDTPIKNSRKQSLRQFFFSRNVEPSPSYAKFEKTKSELSGEKNMRNILRMDWQVHALWAKVDKRDQARLYADFEACRRIIAYYETQNNPGISLEEKLTALSIIPDIETDIVDSLSLNKDHAAALSVIDKLVDFAVRTKKEKGKVYLTTEYDADKDFIRISYESTKELTALIEDKSVKLLTEAAEICQEKLAGELICQESSDGKLHILISLTPNAEELKQKAVQLKEEIARALNGHNLLRASQQSEILIGLLERAYDLSEDDEILSELREVYQETSSKLMACLEIAIASRDEEEAWEILDLCHQFQILASGILDQEMRAFYETWITTKLIEAKDTFLSQVNIEDLHEISGYPLLVEERMAHDDLTLSPRAHPGGIATVFEAIDPTNGEKVAIKDYKHPGEALPFGEGLKAREKELSALTEVRLHPNVVTLIEELEAEASLVLEFLEGSSLDELQTKKLSVKDILILTLGILKGTLQAHQKGFILRDIAPKNVKVNSQGIPQVYDFNIAERIGRRFSPGHGSSFWAAPEQFKGPLTRASVVTDIYALGELLYYLSTGEEPFSALEIDKWSAHLLLPLHRGRQSTLAPSLINKTDHLAKVRDSLSKKGVPKPIIRSIRSIISRCTRKNPRFRYQSVEEVAYDLIEALQMLRDYSDPVS